MLSKVSFLGVFSQDNEVPRHFLTTLITKNGLIMAKITVDANQVIDLGKRQGQGGIKMQRIFTKEGVWAYDTAKWKKQDIKMFASGESIFSRENVEVPAHWGENALKITVSKYIFGKTPGTPEYEDSLKHVFDRIANTYTIWGYQMGYFADENSALIFNQEVKYMLLHQIWAPNSPVWFNIGHWEQWRWGRPDLRDSLKGKGNTAYFGQENGKGGVEAVRSDNHYLSPQMSACFILGVKDSMDEILRHQYTEGCIFSSGSGIGINISSIRSEGEPITGKGSASGPLSFDRGWDRMAGAIKSGGKTRRAARMVVMYSDHPDVFEFINTKFKQEELAKVILQEHNVNFALRKLAEQKLQDGTPEEQIAAKMLLSTPFVVDKSYSPGMDDLVYGQTLSNQNANHTVSMKSGFWMAFKNGEKYATRWVKDPSHIVKTYDPMEFLEIMSKAIWNNAEPGLHNNDIINFWSTFKDEVWLEASNPCSEYLGPVFSSCNLSSFNVLRFYKNGVFDTEKFKLASQIAMMAADMNVSKGGFPIEDIAINTVAYRTTGIGLANLGGLLMSLGIPYDSPEGRMISSSLTSLLTSCCYAHSAEMGDMLGDFVKFGKIKGSMKRVLNMHALMHEHLKSIAGMKPAFKKVGDLPEVESFSADEAIEGFKKSIGSENIALDKEWLDVMNVASDLWTSVRSAKSFRNSFVTCIAPTGTISAPLGIYEEGTTSAEPEYSLVKHKQLSGGGMMTLINGLVPQGLSKLGFGFEQIATIVAEVSGLAGLESFLNSKKIKDRIEILKGISDGGEICKAIIARIGSFNDDDEYQQFFSYLSGLSEKGKLPISDAPLFYGCGHMEGIPWINEKTLKVFDCANKPFGGERFIGTDGHLKMLGALQPFISGASSKTINMPSSSTQKDITDSLIESHALGIKCIAIYRDGSKANAVYSTRLDSSEVQDAWAEVLKTATQIRIQEHANPIRKRLPYRRWGQTVKFSIGENLSGFMTVGISDTGHCSEIFGTLGQGGSLINGMFGAFCKAFSIALQYGVPFDAFISSFKYMTFDPAGWVRIGDYNDDYKPDIHSCKSIVDLLMQLLDWMFPSENGRRLRSLDQQYINSLFQSGDESLRISSIQKSPMQTELPLSASTPAKVKKDKAMNSALTCPKCHSYAYVFDGKCRSCRDCGYKDGGCGA